MRFPSPCRWESQYDIGGRESVLKASSLSMHPIARGRESPPVVQVFWKRDERMAWCNRRPTRGLCLRSGANSPEKQMPSRRGGSKQISRPVA